MEECAASGGARIIREPGQNFNRKFMNHNTDTRFDRMYKLILSLKILSTYQNHVEGQSEVRYYVPMATHKCS
jgi:hypothetical protein